LLQNANCISGSAVALHGGHLSVQCAAANVVIGRFLRPADIELMGIGKLATIGDFLSRAWAAASEGIIPTPRTMRTLRVPLGALV